jgi:phosphohistidine phosphatase
LPHAAAALEDASAACNNSPESGAYAMKVIFVRHAQAEPRGQGLADADRRLVKEGRQQARITAKALDAIGEKVELVLTSPLARARETAAELDRTLVELLDKGTSGICLVGHAPTLGDYIARLIGVKAGLSETVDLTKSGAGCVEIEKPTKPLVGTLKWLLRRDHLAALAGKG